MGAADLEAIGQMLAARHGAEVPEPPVHSLVSFAERPRDGGWSMRSSLVRFAQPEPVRAAALLTQIRRLDAVLAPLGRSLERRFVSCDRQLEESPAPDPVEPYPDIRTADLARVARAQANDVAAMIDSYSAVSPLDAEERAAVPLLAVALELDDLGDDLARWADRGSADPPIEAVDSVVATVTARLDELSVPIEDGPPGRGRR